MSDSDEMLALTRATLASRPSRPPDFAAESRALCSLADELAERPEAVLTALCKTIVQFCKAGSAGVSLMSVSEVGTPVFFWPAIAGAWASFVGGTMPRYASPCGVVVRTAASLLFPGEHEFFREFVGVEWPLVEVLLAPFFSDGQPVGTVWAICHSPQALFEREDQRFLESVSHFAAAAYQALRGSEARQIANDRLSRILSNAEIIGLWDWRIPEDQCVSDERFARLFGVDPARAAAGAPMDDFLSGIHSDDRVRVKDELADAMRTGEPFSSECRLLAPAGEVHHVIARGRCERSETDVPLRFPGVVIDVSKQRRAEQALEELNASLEERVTARTQELMAAEQALRQAQKMDAVGQLTGGLAHDFNNLLAGISGALELMQMRMRQGRVDDVERYMIAAQSASKRAAALTHRLLAFSRRQTLEPKAININQLVVGMEELIRRTVGPTIVLEVVGASGLWPALVDPHQLENALLNLCINARDAMPDGGRITVETANKWMDDHAARQHDMPPGQYLSLCVTDTGTGMSREVIAKAFEPFFTTKPLGQGTGLGLSMIYGFARQSGGQVRIYSEVGQGTTVCLYLPRHYGMVDESDRAERPEVVPFAEHRETILIVDDEPTVLMLVTDVLEDLGYRTIEAADSATGLKVLQSDVRIDLLVTDVGLPGGMNGRQMADAGRMARPDLKVLFITGYAENAVIGNGHLEPGMQVLTKPFVIEALGLRVKDLIAAG